MNFLNKVPGPLLVFLGACTLSFGGLIVKSFEGANLWQILFWRSIFFSIVVLVFLTISHKKNFFRLKKLNIQKMKLQTKSANKAL